MVHTRTCLCTPTVARRVVAGLCRERLGGLQQLGCSNGDVYQEAAPCGKMSGFALHLNKSFRHCQASDSCPMSVSMSDQLHPSSHTSHPHRQISHSSLHPGQHGRGDGLNCFLGKIKAPATAPESSPCMT